MTAPWSLTRGATVHDHGVRFTVWAPHAAQIDVRLAQDGEATEQRLRPVGEGVFEGEVPGVSAGSDYRYRLDANRELPDPVSRHQPYGVHGPSRVVDPTAFAWSDAKWVGRELADLVIYELHVGAFTAAGTFDAVAERFAELGNLGVTAIELMPVAEFPGARNWGYDGASPYAPQSTYGGPDGLRRLVDAAHAADLAVVLDVVYNHLGPEGNYLPAFGPYFTDRYRTPWGSALNFDDAGSDEVRRYVVDNALYWVTEFHIDALRLDAVHGIFDFSAHHLLQAVAEAVHAQGEILRRRTLVIAESDLNDPRLIRSPATGGYGIDAQWSDDFHHAVHAALTGERDGYYEDFGDRGLVARALRDRFVYAGTHSAHRRRRHGAKAEDLPADRFVVFVQNHDQVGNRAGGERLSTLISFEAQKLAASLLLLSPYVPLIFMGEEYGESRPFLYFVSHGDSELVEAVRAGRRREFAAFGWRAEVPDPQAEETFCRSQLAWERRRAQPNAALYALYHDLLALRRDMPLLRPGAAETRVHDGPEWVGVEYAGAGQRRLLALFNLTSQPREAGLVGWRPADWSLRFDASDARYARAAPPVAPPAAAMAPPAGGAALSGYGAVLYEEATQW